MCYNFWSIKILFAHNIKILIICWYQNFDLKLWKIEQASSLVWSDFSGWKKPKTAIIERIVLVPAVGFLADVLYDFITINKKLTIIFIF